MWLKHYALNPQESGRYVLDGLISDAALRESDLLAFEIAMKVGQPGSVMCAYNKVNGDWACENHYLLTESQAGLGFQGMGDERLGRCSFDREGGTCRT